MRFGLGSRPEQQLDENFAEWAAAANKPWITDEERAQASGAILDIWLEHATSIDHIPGTTEQGVISTQKYRIDHPEEVRNPLRVGNHDAVEQALGLHDYVCFSYMGRSPMNHGGGVLIKIPANEMLRRPRTIVFPFDAPFLNAGLPSRKQDTSHLQAMALRVTDYIKLLPTYLAVERQGSHASEICPEWLRQSLHSPKSFQAGEIKVAGNLPLTGTNWWLELWSALPSHADLMTKLTPLALTHVIDRSQN